MKEHLIVSTGSSDGGGREKTELKGYARRKLSEDKRKQSKVPTLEGNCRKSRKDSAAQNEVVGNQTYNQSTQEFNTFLLPFVFSLHFFPHTLLLLFFAFYASR